MNLGGKFKDGSDWSPWVRNPDLMTQRDVEPVTENSGAKEVNLLVMSRAGRVPTQLGPVLAKIEEVEEETEDTPKASSATSNAESSEGDSSESGKLEGESDPIHPSTLPPIQVIPVIAVKDQTVAPLEFSLLSTKTG